MRKKILFMTLAASMMLTACGGRAQEEKENVPAAQETAGAEETAEPAKEPEEKKEEQETETEGEEQEPGEEAASEDPFIKGILSDNGWESEYLGMRYTLPEGMYMATEEELNETMGLGAEALSEDFGELQLKYAQMRTEYEMMSLDATGATNVVITVEKLPFSNMDAKAYVQALEKQLGQVSAIPYTIISDDETVSIAGKDYIKVSTQIETGGDAVKQDYNVCVIDGRAICLVITYSDETAELAETILNAFSEY